MKRNMFYACLLYLSVSGFAFAFEAKDKSELDEIFSAAIQAVGGEKELRKIKSLEASAICVGPKGEYTTEIVSFRSDKTLFRQTFTYREKDTNIFINNNTAWEKLTKTDDFSIVSPFQKLVVQLHEYQKMTFDFQTMFSGFELVGEEDFNAKSSVKVSAKNALGGTIYLYFDKETKLLTGYVLPVPGSSESVKNVFHEWKTVGKLKLPSKITATDSSGDWVLNFEKITVNRTDEKILDVPPRVEDLAELLRLHKRHQDAHLTYNAEQFVETFAENLSTVQRGEVITRNKTENLKRIKSYFNSFKFKKWEDVKPPVIKISKDGTLATIIVEKIVEGTYKNEKGETVESVTEFAWLEVWEKIEGKWKVTTVASTRKSNTDTPE